MKTPIKMILGMKTPILMILLMKTPSYLRIIQNFLILLFLEVKIWRERKPHLHIKIKILTMTIIQIQILILMEIWIQIQQAITRVYVQMEESNISDQLESRIRNIWNHLGSFRTTSDHLGHDQESENFPPVGQNPNPASNS